MNNYIKKIIALIILIITSPLLLLFFVVTKLTSSGTFIFKQKRLGKNKKPFYMYKIRTMVNNAEKLKPSFYHLNEADGPVFKIREDPRYTKIGKFLSHTGLDEIPQLVNIIKGEMDFVGPRPLPVTEALKVPKKYQKRFTVAPGMTSTWIINGAHKLTFDQWMKLDVEYAKNKNLTFDIKILAKTFTTIILLVINKLLNIENT